MCLPHSFGLVRYLVGMGPTATDTKTLLWRNVAALMHREWGEERLSELARRTGLGAATMTRIKKQETSVGLDVLEAIAKFFKVEPWQLITQDLGTSLYVIDAERRIVPVYHQDPEGLSRKRQARAA